MLGKLLLAFIAIPLVEFMLLVWIAERTSILATIALVIVTGIVGSLLARAQGLRAWQRFREAASQGRMPSKEIQDGLMIAFAAALLLTPGLLTDLFGFALLIPPTRILVRGWLARRFANSVQFTYHSGGTHFSGWQGGGETIDSTSVSVDEDESISGRHVDSGPTIDAGPGPDRPTHHQRNAATHFTSCQWRIVTPRGERWA